MFKKLVNLETFVLPRIMNNNDCAVPKNAFIELSKLKVLDFSSRIYNKLNLDDRNELQNLETLKFNNCYAAKLSGWKDVKVSLPKLKEIYLNHNSFDCNNLREVVAEFTKDEIEIVDLKENGEKRFFAGCCFERRITKAP